MKIVEYRRHKIDGRVVDPQFISNGSQFLDPDTQSWIGTVPDVTDYYVPDTLTELTEEQLIAKVLDIHNRYPFLKRIPVDGSGDYVDMTNQEVTQMVTDWVASVQPK
jgi:hypothetical protein